MYTNNNNALILQNEYMKENFLIKIETWHKPDMGHQENVSTLYLAERSLLGSRFLRVTECDFECVFRLACAGARSGPWHLEEGGCGVYWHRWQKSGGAKGKNRLLVWLNKKGRKKMLLFLILNSLNMQSTTGMKFILACLKIHMSKNANHHGSRDFNSISL